MRPRASHILHKISLPLNFSSQQLDVRPQREQLNPAIKLFNGHGGNKTSCQKDINFEKVGWLSEWSVKLSHIQHRKRNHTTSFPATSPGSDGGTRLAASYAPWGRQLTCVCRGGSADQRHDNSEKHRLPVHHRSRVVAPLARRQVRFYWETSKKLPPGRFHGFLLVLRLRSLLLLLARRFLLDMSREQRTRQTRQRDVELRRRWSMWLVDGAETRSDDTEHTKTHKTQQNHLTRTHERINCKSS